MSESPSTGSRAEERRPSARPTQDAQGRDGHPWGLPSPPGTGLGCCAWQEKQACAVSTDPPLCENCASL